jgi:hypothetical protein
MRNETHAKFCSNCGGALPAKARRCPQCGVKIKKPFYRNWWFWLIAILLIGAIGGGINGTPANSPSSASPDAAEPGPASPVPTDTPEPTPTPTPAAPAFANELERALWKAAADNGGELASVESIPVEGSDALTLVAAVRIPNDEAAVNAVLQAMSEAILAAGGKDSAILNFGDIEEGEDAPVLVMAGVYGDGTIDITSTSLDYNSARNQWIRGQFSLWDGAHTELEKLIVQNLNDESSYKHIETGYRDVSSEAIRDELNGILADAGYEQRVEVGDLFIQTEFSAKNVFGGTVKNVAYGISSYANNTITLIGIE